MATLAVEHVSVNFGGVHALDDVSLTAAPGRITGLIGPNGAGKTTLFNVVSGLQQPTGGRVLLDGVDLAGVSPHRRARRGLARTFQQLELFATLSVRENVQAAASMSARRRKSPQRPTTDAVIDRTLDLLGLRSLADTPASALPTGQGRLLELARALMTQPDVLLLDEPASGQDEYETERFGVVLQRLAADGISVFLVEHDMRLVMSVCDHVHVLDLGHVLASGTPDAVRADAAVVAAYLGQGFGG